MTQIRVRKCFPFAVGSEMKVKRRLAVQVHQVRAASVNVTLTSRLPGALPFRCRASPRVDSLRNTLSPALRASHSREVRAVKHGSQNVTVLESALLLVKLFIPPVIIVVAGHYHLQLNCKAEALSDKRFVGKNKRHTKCSACHHFRDLTRLPP